MTAVNETRSRQQARPVLRFFDPTDFGMGHLVPVVGGHGGAGASGVALALADAAAEAGMNTLLIDGADPARSGLSNIWTTQLRSDPPCRDGAVVGSVRRRHGVLGRQLRGDGRPFRRDHYPALTEWLSDDFLRAHAPFDLTVVDVGWDAWTGFDEVRFGPMAWIGARASSSTPVLVATASAASLRLTAGVHALWSAARAAGDAEAEPRLALTRTAAPLDRLAPYCPPSLHGLLAAADVFPAVKSTAATGWDEVETPSTLMAASAGLLTALGTHVPDRLRSQRPNPHRFRRTTKET